LISLVTFILHNMLTLFYTLLTIQILEFDSYIPFW